jgi:hypothetical protein
MYNRSNEQSYNTSEESKKSQDVLILGKHHLDKARAAFAHTVYIKTHFDGCWPADDTKVKELRQLSNFERAVAQIEITRGGAIKFNPDYAKKFLASAFAVSAGGVRRVRARDPIIAGTEVGVTYYLRRELISSTTEFRNLEDNQVPITSFPLDVQQQLLAKRKKADIGWDLAMQFGIGDKVIAAIRREWQGLREIKKRQGKPVIHTVPRSQVNTQVMRSRQLIDLKLSESNAIVTVKVRCVPDGGQESLLERGHKDSPSESILNHPTMGQSEMRHIIAHAAMHDNCVIVADVPRAFTQTDAFGEDEVKHFHWPACTRRAPLEYQQQIRDAMGFDDSKVLACNICVYGFKEAPSAWGATLTRALHRIGWNNRLGTPCTYWRSAPMTNIQDHLGVLKYGGAAAKSGKSCLGEPEASHTNGHFDFRKLLQPRDRTPIPTAWALLGHHVDDLIISCPRDKIQQICDEIKREFTMDIFQIVSKEGDTAEFCGKRLTMSQGFFELGCPEKCRYAPEFKLNKITGTDRQLDEQEISRYRTCIGAVAFPIGAVRPDLSLLFHQAARGSHEKRTEQQVKSLQLLVSIMRQTPDVGLRYKILKTKPEKLRILMFHDAAKCSEPKLPGAPTTEADVELGEDGRKPTGGYLLGIMAGEWKIHGNYEVTDYYPIDWASENLLSVAPSPYVAEVRYCRAAIESSLYHERFIRHYAPHIATSELMTDSKSFIDRLLGSKNIKMADRSIYDELAQLKYHLRRDDFISKFTNDLSMVADQMTKSFARSHPKVATLLRIMSTSQLHLYLPDRIGAKPMITEGRW